mmetsp:Transcript_39552/g.60418  ORF Transcript_39552/g.60418 Transcript_39552/m.60418 type:complete len:98 (+) Transcript_39552:789-1082(+)
MDAPSNPAPAQATVPSGGDGGFDFLNSGSVQPASNAPATASDPFNFNAPAQQPVGQTVEPEKQPESKGFVPQLLNQANPMMMGGGMNNGMGQGGFMG